MLTKGQIGFLNEHTRGKWSLNLSTGRVDIVGDFDCSMRSYTGFGGIEFGRVTGDFCCYNNQLQSLDGCPRFVGGNFICSPNLIQTLVGAPEVIGGRFESWPISIPAGQWSLATLAREYSEAVGHKKSLIGTLASPEDLQRRINLDPEKAAVELKSIVGLPEYQCLRWPDGLQSEVDLLSDLDRIGQ